MDQTLVINNAVPFVALALGAGGIAVPLASQLIKKLFGMQSAAAIHTMVVIVTAAAAIAQYVLACQGLPKEVLGLNLSIIYTASQLVYRYSKFSTSFLNQVSSTYSAGKAALAAPAMTVTTTMPAEIAMTAVPAPVSSTSVAQPAAASEFDS